MRVTFRVAFVAALALVGALPAAAHGATPTCSWSMYGHDLAHSAEQDAACATLTPATAPTLVPKWAFHTDDSVTASPAVVDGRAYVGAWDGKFYALDAATGALRWTYQIALDDREVAFGRIVSSAAVADFDGTHVILFGGGARLYALRDDGDHATKLAEVDVDPRPVAQRTAGHTVEIESSPAVARFGGEQRIFVGMDAHNEAHVGATGLLSFKLVHNAVGQWSFVPLWKFDPETEQVYGGPGLLTAGDPAKAFGCGGVWASPAVDTARKMVFFGTSSCSHTDAGPTYTEGMFGLDAMSGALSWRFRPTIDPAYGDKDLDFGASPNLYTTRGGRDITGNGRKDAVYYARDRASGAPVFSSLTGQPGITGSDFSVGGFLGTPAVQRDGAGRAVAIVGTTAIPVPFDSDADGSNQRPGDVQRTITAVRAIDPADGHLLWAYQLDGPSYGGVSIANGVALVPDTFGSNLLALDIATGRPLAMLPVPAPPSSTPVAVGDSVYMGGGTRTTDAEYKSFGNDLQTLGNHPLSPVSGVFAFRVAAP